MPKWTRIALVVLVVGLPVLLAAIGPEPEPCEKGPRLMCERIKTAAQSSLEAGVAPEAASMECGGRAAAFQCAR